MKTPLEKLQQIENEVAALDERFARLAGANHVPRRKSDKRLHTVFSQCDPGCPTCALELEIGMRRLELGDLQRAALIENARESFVRKRNHRIRSSKPRMRTPSLWKRGFQCVLKEFPEITPKEFRNLLPRTYDAYNDEDVELRLEGDDIVVEDLNSGDTQIVKKSNHPVYLQRARNS